MTTNGRYGYWTDESGQMREACGENCVAGYSWTSGGHADCGK